MMQWIFPLIFLSLIPLSASVGIYQQCGGDGYTGSTYCDWPLQCFRRSRWYSSCQTTCPSADWECGSVINYPNGGSLAEAWEQCGGEGWNGPQGCSQYVCQYRSKWYAQCRPDCPAGWICQGSEISWTPESVYSTTSSSDYVTELPIDLNTDGIDIITPNIPDEDLSEHESSLTNSSLNVPSSSLIDDNPDAILGRHIVSQMLGGTIYDIDAHPYESQETIDLYDRMVEHIIEIAEIQEPGSMARFGIALQSEDFEERLAAWEDMSDRIEQIFDSLELTTAMMLDPLFADHLVPTDILEDFVIDSRAIRADTNPCNGPIPDIGKVNGLYGDGRSGILGTLGDALKTGFQNYKLNVATLAAIEMDIGPKPDPESRLGAFYATRGYKHNTVGNAVHRAIGAIYLIFGTAGEEKIGRVFNHPDARALYGASVTSSASECIANIEYRYWDNVKKENPFSYGGALGEFVKPRARDCIQRILSFKLCSSSKSRSLSVALLTSLNKQEKKSMITKTQSRRRRQTTVLREALIIPPGYVRTNYICMKKPVYCNSKASNALACIVEDRTSHKGGVWKAGPEKTWAQKDCPFKLRSGTYDANLNRIAD